MLSKEKHTDFLRDLKAMIENKGGSMAKFCRENGIDRSNLVKVFSENEDRKRQPDLSVGMYIRIMVGLGEMDKEDLLPDDSQFHSIPLRIYLSINANKINNSMLAVAYS